MGAMQPGFGLDTELLFERAHEGVEKIVAAGLGLEHLFTHHGVDDGVKQDGAHPGLAKLLINACPYLARFLLGLDKGDGYLFEGQGNWLNTAWPKTSAVMAVPSDT